MCSSAVSLALCAVEIQALQLLPAFDGGDAFICYVLTPVQAEIQMPFRVLIFSHALIGDVSQGEIDDGEIGKFVEMAQIKIPDPRSAQTDAGNVTLRIFCRCGRRVCRSTRYRLRMQTIRNERQRTDQTNHLIYPLLLFGSEESRSKTTTAPGRAAFTSSTPFSVT